MPRKLQENIFPHIGRQVHAIIDHGHALLALQRQMAGPRVQFQVIWKGLRHRTHWHSSFNRRRALHQQAFSDFLHFQVVMQRVRQAGSFRRACRGPARSTGNSPRKKRLCAARWRKFTTSDIMFPSKPARQPVCPSRPSARAPARMRRRRRPAARFPSPSAN